MRKIISVIALNVLPLFICQSASAQLKLSAAGAMAALNSNPNTVQASAAVSPVITVTNTPSLMVPATGVPAFQYAQPNDRTVSIAYQSALAWWSGNLDYKAAAQSLRLSGDLAQISIAMAAAAYILSDISFTQLQSYSQRRATMIIRANDQSPVHFPPVHNVNGADVQFNAYTPTVSSFNVVVPVKF